MGKLLKAALLVFLVGIVVSLVAFFMNAGGNDSFFGDQHFTIVQDSIEIGTLSDINLNLDNREIIVERSTTGKIEVEYYVSERHPITKSTTSTTLSFDSNSEWYFNIFSGWNFYQNEVYLEFHLLLPEGVDWDLDLNTSNGEIGVTEIDNIGTMSISSSNGVITLENVTADTIDVVTSNGALNFTNLVAQSIEGRTSNGKITVTNLTASTGAIELKTSNGAITVTTISTNELYCQTSNGSIDVTRSGVYADYDTSVNTSLGTITVDGHVVEDGHYNTSADDKITLNTSNGSITLDFLG